MAEIHIENIVATSSYPVEEGSNELDLDTISKHLVNSKYNPDKLAGVIYNLELPKAAIILLRDGKLVCTGTKSIDDAKIALEQLDSQLKAGGIAIGTMREIETRTLIGSAELERELDLDATAKTIKIGEVEYEPEKFPAIVWHLDTPKLTVLIFKSGKLVFTDARSRHELDDALAKVVEVLGKAEW